MSHDIPRKDARGIRDLTHAVLTPHITQRLLRRGFATSLAFGYSYNTWDAPIHAHTFSLNVHETYPSRAMSLSSLCAKLR